jgi:hypothetical protein
VGPSPVSLVFIDSGTCGVLCAAAPFGWYTSGTLSLAKEQPDNPENVRIAAVDVMSASQSLREITNPMIDVERPRLQG